MGDISSTLRALNQRINEKICPFNTQWFRPIRKKILDDINSYKLKKGEAFTIPGTVHILNEIMDDDDLLISDVGSHKLWIARNYLTASPNGCIMSNGLASMGIALPGGVAASLVYPDRRIVAAMGDGGFLMNSQELETAKRLNCHFTTTIFNDNDYGLISWKQMMNRGRSTSTCISNPDFKKYTESFGIKAYRPRTVKELKDQLTEAMTSKELCVVEVPVVTHVNQELVKKLKKDLEQSRQKRHQRK